MFWSIHRFTRLWTSCCFKTLRMASINLCSAAQDSKDLAVFLTQQASVSNLLTAIWEEAVRRPLPRTSVLPLKSKGHIGMGRVLVMPPVEATGRSNGRLWLLWFLSQC